MESLRLQLATNSGNVVASSKAGTGEEVLSGDFFAEFLKSLTGENASLGGLADLADTDSDTQNTNAMMLASELLSGNYGFDWLLSSALNGTADSSASFGIDGASLMSGAGNMNLAALLGSGKMDLAALLGDNANSAEVMALLAGAGTGSTSSLSSLFSSEQNNSSTNSTDLLRKLVLLQNAQTMVDSDAFKNVSEEDGMKALNLALSGNLDAANKIVEGANQMPLNESANSARNESANSANYAAALDTANSVEQSQTAQQNIVGQAETVQRTASTQNRSYAVLENQNQSQAVGTTQDVTAQSNAQSGESAFEGDMNFSSSVYQAQQLMKSQSTQDTTVSYDAAAQAAAQNSVPIVEAVSTNSEANEIGYVEIDDFEEQLKAGLESGDLTTEKDFTIKLKPEGLGEVVVKLAKVQDHTVVSIIAANGNAARLLNEDLSLLRTSMQTMNVEINQVVSGEQADLVNLQQQMQQQAGQHQFNQNQSARQSAYSVDSQNDEPPFTPEIFQTNEINIYA